MRKSSKSDVPAGSKLLKVEDLIHLAMGLPEKNVVNFKLLQTILTILAGQMRLLGQQVELNLDDDLDATEVAVKEAKEKADKAKLETSGEAGKKRGKGKKDVEAKSSSLSVTERDGGPGKDKVLVVEQGAKRKESGGPVVGSIAVVPQSEFQELVLAVRALQQSAGPVPAPTMPANADLRKGIATGSASLTDTMHAMHLTARVEAAENALAQMSLMLTELAKTGALPRELAATARNLMVEVARLKKDVATGGGQGAAGSAKAAKSVSVLPPDKKEKKGKKAPAIEASVTVGFAAMAMKQSEELHAVPSQPLAPNMVTHPEVKESLRELLHELMKKFNSQSNNAFNAIDIASNKAKLVALKMEQIIKMNDRVNALHAQAAEYSQQLNTMEEGLSVQMQCFQDQIAHMHEELIAGMGQLEIIGSTESSAVKELKQRYDGLLVKLDEVLKKHSVLNNIQTMLAADVQRLVQRTEIMREQKADREEVLDGLRDKADKEQLQGLLSEEEFQQAKQEIDMRLEICNEKFRVQENVWKMAMKDLREAADSKAELSQLILARENAQEQLMALKQGVQRLTVMLGDPKAAILCRKLSRDGTCGVCSSTALMKQGSSKSTLPPAPPPRGPELAWLPREEDRPVCTTLGTSTDTDIKLHLCNRYVGGSHTVVTSAREPCPPGPPIRPARHYQGLGSDGKMYQLEELLQPCEECNKNIPGSTDLPIDGRGDGAIDRRVTICEDSDVAPKIVVIDELEEKTGSLGSPEGHISTIAERSRHSTSEGPRSSLIAELRLSMMGGPSSLAMAFVADQLRDIGDVVKGRVTIVDEEAAMRAALMQEIKEKNAAEEQEGKDVEGDGGGEKGETEGRAEGETGGEVEGETGGGAEGEQKQPQEQPAAETE